LSPDLKIHGQCAELISGGGFARPVGYCALLPWAISVVKVGEVTPSGLVLMNAQVANMDANKQITAIKPVYFEPRPPLPAGFS
jgi:hypothetical protein